MDIKIGPTIKLTREYLNLSAKELSSISGVSTSVISLLENGQREDTSISNSVKIATALGLSVSQLIEISQEATVFIDQIEEIQCKLLLKIKPILDKSKLCK